MPRMRWKAHKLFMEERRNKHAQHYNAAVREEDTSKSAIEMGVACGIDAGTLPFSSSASKEAFKEAYAEYMAKDTTAFNLGLQAGHACLVDAEARFGAMTKKELQNT